MQTNQQLRRIYGDILRGMSPFLCSKGTVYIKHATPLDTCDTDVTYLEYFNKAVERGLPTEEKKLAFLIKKNLWSAKNEEEIKNLDFFIVNLKKTKSKLAIPSQREAIEKQINENLEKLINLKTERIDLLDLTAEFYASKKTNEFYLRKMAFEDSSLKTPLISDSDFEDIDSGLNDEINKIFGSFSELFNQNNIKKTALLTIFLNAFSICKDSPFIFYGKPVVELTLFQTDLFIHGRAFRSIISEHGDKIPHDCFDDPDKLIDWHESAKNTQALLDKQPDSGNVMLFGTNKDDLKKLGMENTGNVSLAEMAKKKGGKLTMKELMELEGS